jgi:hypothetical protein
MKNVREALEFVYATNGQSGVRARCAAMSRFTHARIAPPSGDVE